MKYFINRERIAEELNRRAAHAAALAKAWESVERVHTKAGKDFKILHKNFKGVYYTNALGLERFQISANTEKGWADDQIYLENYAEKDESGKYYVSSVDILEAIGKTEIDPARIYSVSYGQGRFMLNADELEKVIVYRADKRRKEAAEISKTLKDLESKLSEIEKHLEAVRNCITEQPEGLKSALYNQLDTIKFFY